ncbi:hypothetical protein ACIQXQ_20085 [Peribacillus sp. NPDC097198]
MDFKELNKIVGKIMELTGYDYEFVMNKMCLTEIKDLYIQYKANEILKGE